MQGKSVTFDYKAQVQVKGSVGVSWEWKGLLGLGILSGGVSGEIFAQGQGDLNFAGKVTYCPPSTLGGTPESVSFRFLILWKTVWQEVR